MKATREFLRSRSGAAAAELALMLPFIVVLLFGAIEVGYYFYNEHQVVKGVRDGARYASRQSFVSINCTGTAIPGQIITDIQEVTRTGRRAGGTARVPGWVNSDVDVVVNCPGDTATAVTTGIYTDEPDAPIIEVSTTVSYQSLFGGIGVLTDDLSLSATQQSAVMGI